MARVSFGVVCAAVLVTGLVLARRLVRGSVSAPAPEARSQAMPPLRRLFAPSTATIH